MSIRLISLSFLFVILTGCGGGGSSSGGASAPVPAPAASIVGQYSGVWTATLSSPGIPDEVVDINLSITVTNTTITITDQEFIATGTISPTNGFDARTPRYSTTIGDFPCEGEFTFSGIIDPVAQQVSGNSRSQFTCSVRGRAIRIDIVGPFSASKVSGKLSGITLNQALLQFIR